MRLVKTKPKAVVRLSKPCKVTRLVKHTVVNNKAHHVALVKHYAKRYGITQKVALALVGQESTWDPRAKSPSGALGLTQMLPSTAAEMGVDPLDPKQSIEGGMRYFAQQLAVDHNYPNALARYNMGPNAFKRCQQRKGGCQLPTETRKYIAIIWKGKKV